MRAKVISDRLDAEAFTSPLLSGCYELSRSIFPSPLNPLSLATVSRGEGVYRLSPPSSTAWQKGLRVER